MSWFTGVLPPTLRVSITSPGTQPGLAWFQQRVADSVKFPLPVSDKP